MFNIATPISHLFKDPEQAKIITAHSDCLEVRDEGVEAGVDRVELFHCDVQPIHRLHEEVFEYLRTRRDQHPQLRLVTFHCASNCDLPSVIDGMFQPGGSEYSRQDMQRNAEHNFARIRKIFGDAVALGIENTNYYPTAAYRDITDPEFISEIVLNNGLNFLFDIPHARITARNRDIGYMEYKNKLPLAKTIQIHISSYTAENGLVRDTHDAPDGAVWSEVKDFIAQYGPRYVTVEYYKNYDTLLSILRELKGMRDGLSRSAL